VIRTFPLRRHEDERGWFSELARASWLPKPIRQANLAWSRQGVIRGLHYHLRGQDDLFLCLQGTVRVVVLDRESGETFCQDIGEATSLTATRRSRTASSVIS
jgi:dTDP-4-dehydrorhamnose 3,5-epimerase-like enzyme